MTERPDPDDLLARLRDTPAPPPDPRFGDDLESSLRVTHAERQPRAARPWLDLPRLVARPVAVLLVLAAALAIGVVTTRDRGPQTTAATPPPHPTAAAPPTVSPTAMPADPPAATPSPAPTERAGAPSVRPDPTAAVADPAPGGSATAPATTPGASNPERTPGPPADESTPSPRPTPSATSATSTPSPSPTPTPDPAPVSLRARPLVDGPGRVLLGWRLDDPDARVTSFSIEVTRRSGSSVRSVGAAERSVAIARGPLPASVVVTALAADGTALASSGPVAVAALR